MESVWWQCKSLESLHQAIDHATSFKSTSLGVFPSSHAIKNEVMNSFFRDNGVLNDQWKDDIIKARSSWTLLNVIRFAWLIRYSNESSLILSIRFSFYLSLFTLFTKRDIQYSEENISETIFKKKFFILLENLFMILNYFCNKSNWIFFLLV